MDRSRLHGALDVFLDALDEYRSRPPKDELVRVRDLPFEIEARRELVRTGQLPVTKIGRELFTSRRAVTALHDKLPRAKLPGPPPKAKTVDELEQAIRRRAVRRAK